MAILGLDHVQLAIPVGGETQAREFFAELLGTNDKPIEGYDRIFTQDPFGNRIEIMEAL